MKLLSHPFLHDVGHLLLDQNIYSKYNEHEKIGAEFIKDFFSDKIFNCIRMHVDAKKIFMHKRFFLF